MPADDPDSSHPARRASDADRERVATVLREHAAQGRLDTDELEERTALAYRARTQPELEALLRDLPAPMPAPARRRLGKAERELRQHAASYVVVNLMLIGIWAATGAGYFWPIWPLLGWGAGLALHAWQVRLGRDDDAGPR